MTYIMIFIVALCFTTAAVFVDEVLVKGTDTTDCPEDANTWSYRCFAMHTLYDHPLNCSDTQYIKENNITDFQCYRITLSYVDAAGDATGMFASSVFIMDVSSWLILKFTKENFLCTCSSKCKCYTMIVFYVVAIPSPLVIILTLTYFLLGVPTLARSIHYTSNLLQNINLSFTIVVAFFFPWCWFKKS